LGAVVGAGFASDVIRAAGVAAGGVGGRSSNWSAAPREMKMQTARDLLATPGFVQPLVAFVASIGVSNVVSAFIKETLVASGMESQTTIDLVGAGFQAAIVLGGIGLGGYVDRSKRYKDVTLGCFVLALVLLQPIGLAESPQLLVILSILGLGALIGPVQPINAELAVEVAYPADENSIEALQQLCGNLFSALLVPVAEIAAHTRLDTPGGGHVTGDSLLLSAIVVGATAYYRTFNSALKRSALDCAGEEDFAPPSCEVVYDSTQLEGASLESPMSELLSDNSPPPAAPSAAAATTASSTSDEQ